MLWSIRDSAVLLLFVLTLNSRFNYSSNQGFLLSRRDDSNSCTRNGEVHQCQFFLFCLLGGGTSMGSCSGRLLTTCCVKPNLRRSRPSNFRQRALNKGDASCGRTAWKPQSRIIGGQDALYGEFPWQAHIKIIQQQCGGVIVSPYYVVTAAHCVYRARLPQITVVLGAYDIHDQSFQLQPALFMKVSEKRLHPNFKFSPSHPDRYDVALLRLHRRVHYQENVLPICLPPYKWNFRGWRAVVIGWGKTDPALRNRYGTRLLQKVEVPIISNEECEYWHRSRGIKLKIYPEMICAGYEHGKKDACVGDSGGPLMVNMHGKWTLVGITSAGFGCAQWRQPGIYHSVSTTVDWITANIR